VELNAETSGAAQVSAPRVSVPGLKIGPLRVDPPVVLAPMAGVTNVAFRRLCRTYGAGLYVSEMIMARALLEGNARTVRMMTFGDDEPTHSVQLYGVHPSIVAAAVGRLVDQSGPDRVDHIDLNFGCPAAKVTRKGGGAALPIHEVLFRAVIAAAVRAAGAVPVTVKLRLGIDQTHRTAVRAGRIAADEGVAAVTLHARTAEQLYSGAADWTAIGELKAAVTSVPVLGNGDIWEASDAVRMMAETGCDGVVIGRGCLGRPWLFRDLADVFAGRPTADPPGLGEVAGIMSAHARLLAVTMGEEPACRDFRKHVGWYLTGFPVGGDLRRRLGQVASLTELDDLLGELDPTVAFPLEAQRMRRGHTGGPRPVALPPGWLTSIDDPSPPIGADTYFSGG
jgi:nifR3 family TIM-barrel protein